MYRITRTQFICRNGEKEVSDEIVDVADLEDYRAKIKKSKHVRINFIYQAINDDEYNRENQAD